MYRYMYMTESNHVVPKTESATCTYNTYKQLSTCKVVYMYTCIYLHLSEDDTPLSLDLCVP